MDFIPKNLFNIDNLPKSPPHKELNLIFRRLKIYNID
jgi:hypothetical protein